MNKYISYDGYQKNVVTMMGTDLDLGDLVELDIDGKAILAKANSKIVGVIVSKNGGFYGVQTSGYVKIDSDEALKVGFNTLVSAAGNKVKTDLEKGREYLVLSVSNGKVGLVL